MSNSMCFVFECKTGLCARETALRLSQKTCGILIGTLSSLRRDCIHRISAETWAKLLYFASALDLATKVCYLAHQETIFGPK
jgi:hypothetical protein